MKAIWKGDEKILPAGVEVTILAVDPADPDARFGRQACWVKWLIDGFEAPMYRSCNMDDLEIEKPKTMSRATYIEDRSVRKTVPCISYGGPEIRQMQEDGSWKVIGLVVVRSVVGGLRDENVIY